MTEIHLTRNVFIAGGAPSVTYNPRDDRRLEDEVRTYLDQSGKALSISGPTKSGKTVLVSRLLPRTEAIWLHGSDITSAEAFWRAIVDWLGLYDEIEVSSQAQGQLGAQVSARIGGGGTGVSVAGSGGTTQTDGRTYSRRRAYADVAREGLAALPVPIVIDDFHYVPDQVKREVARAIKSILPLTHVLMIAVPHEAFEAVREEPDMGGRVWHLKIDHWSRDELAFIAASGFRALNVVDHGGVIADQLVANSFGAPFLMQQLCYDMVTSNRVLQTREVALDLAEPVDGWAAFFQRIADRSAPPVFDRLRRGPKTRGQERIDRKFKDGKTTDIYGAVLHAVASTGPRPAIPQQEIVKTLESLLVDPARGSQVTSCLNQMSRLADETRGTGDAALVFKNDELYLLDPFLSFYLKWGSWPRDVEL